VAEVPVIFQHEQRVGAGTDQHIRIRQQAGGKADARRQAQLIRPRRGLRQCGAQ